MNDISPLVYIVVGVIVIAVLKYVFERRRLESREQEMQSFAAQHGFRSEGDVNPFVGMMNGSEGASPIAADSSAFKNVLRGPTAAGEASLYDFRPLSTADSSARLASTTAAAFRVAGIPEFQIMPQGRFKFGLKDIDFPSHPVFSKRFLLLSMDEGGVRKLFSPAVLDACEALSEKRGWHLNAGWGLLVITFGHARAAELRELVDQSARVAAAMQRQSQ